MMGEASLQSKRNHGASRLGQIISSLAAGASKRYRQHDRDTGMDDETSSVGSASSFTDYTARSQTQVCLLPLLLVCLSDIVGHDFVTGFCCTINAWIVSPVYFAIMWRQSRMLCR